jgi:hypothetical protein
MNELHTALADIGTIRQQLAAGTLFRGFGPTVVAMTGVLAFLTALLQSIWLDDLATDPFLFLACWVFTAVVSAVLIGVEMHARSRRHHGGLATEMILNAIEQFLPSGAAGAAIALVQIAFAPETMWLLPGLWQVFVAIGLFSSLKFLPRTVAIAAGWYFVAGIAALMIASTSQALSPWLMGAPFAIGQLLLATILHFAYGGPDDKQG